MQSSGSSQKICCTKCPRFAVNHTCQPSRFSRETPDFTALSRFPPGVIFLPHVSRFLTKSDLLTTVSTEDFNTATPLFGFHGSASPGAVVFNFSRFLRSQGWQVCIHDSRDYLMLALFIRALAAVTVKVFP